MLAPETISLRICTVRGQRVTLDSDLAALYDVPTKRFNEAVRRNGGKFPADFMFQLSAKERAALRSQFATLDAAPRRARPASQVPAPCFHRARRDHGCQLAQQLARGRGLGVRGARLRTAGRAGQHEPPQRPIGFVTPKDKSEKGSAAARSKT